MKPPVTDSPSEGRMLEGISAFRYLLITGVIVALGLMATRTLFEALPTAHASTSYRQVQAAGDDALSEARKALVEGHQLPEARTAQVSITPVAGPLSVLRAESMLDDQLVSVVQTAGSFRPAPRAQPESSDDLPRLKGDTVNSLLANPDLQVRRIRRDMTLAGESLQGLFVVAPGVKLTLRDVVIKGAIVSDGALSSGSLGEFDQERAPRVTIMGSLRMEPMVPLHGVSIVMPDGVLRSEDESLSLQVQGAIIAHGIQLDGRGSLFGRLVSLEAPVLAPGIELIDQGRVPRSWPGCLDMRGPVQTDFLTYLPAQTNWEDVQPMIRFRFP